MRPRHAGWLLALALVSGCASASKGADREIRAGTITIGFPTDVHRDAEISNGAKIAAREINGAGGIERALRLRLLVRDTRREPARAGRLARSLLAEGARVLIVPCDVDSARSVVRAARGHRVLLLGTCNYDPALVDRTASYWGSAVGANVEMAALADYLAGEGFSAVYVTPPDEPEGKQLERYFRVAAADRGIDVVPEPTPKTALVSLRWAGFTAAFAAGVRSAYAVVGTDLADGAQTRAADDLVFTTFAFPDPAFATDEFYDRYRARYGVHPSSSRSILGYAVVKLLEHVVERAQSAALPAVTDELRGLSWTSPLGDVSYAHGRNPDVEVPIVRVNERRLELVTRASPDEVPAS